MKFLLFNVMVVIALVYLFQTDRQGFRDAADTAYDAVDAVQGLAKDAIGRGRAAVAEVPTAAAAKKWRSDDKPPAADAGIPLPEMPDYPPPAPETALARPLTPALPPALPQALPRALAPAINVDQLKVTPVPVAIKPEVAARRDEVLNGGTPRVTLAEGETLMSSEERRQELLSLAEEMELMFVKRVSR